MNIGIYIQKSSDLRIYPAYERDFFMKKCRFVRDILDGSTNFFQIFRIFRTLTRFFLKIFRIFRTEIRFSSKFSGFSAQTRIFERIINEMMKIFRTETYFSSHFQDSPHANIISFKIFRMLRTEKYFKIIRLGT